MQTEDYVLISALQHYAYCPRQCALIHVEQTFEENLYTLRGQRVHERVNVPEYELIEGVRVERALPLWSHQIGLTGIADVVEFTINGTLALVPRLCAIASSFQPSGWERIGTHATRFKPS